MTTRHCASCHRPISLCMGFVKAGDIVWDSRPERARELCGRCALIMRWTEAGELVRANHQTRKVDDGCLGVAADGVCDSGVGVVDGEDL